MIIGGKVFNIGDHIRVISAKSVLHYDYGMIGNENKESKGLTGIIMAESTYNKNADYIFPPCSISNPAFTAMLSKLSL